MRSAEERLRELEDIEAIRKLKFTYARLVDEHDVDGFVDLFTEDAVWDGREFGRHEGKAAIRAYIEQILREKITWAIHLMTNPEIEVAPSGTEATGRWYLWEPATVGGQPLWMVGKYFERYRKVDGRWLFSHLELRFEFTTPYQSGWVKERFAASR